MPDVAAPEAPAKNPEIANPQAPRIVGDPEKYYRPRTMCPQQRRDAAAGGGPG
jgi:hypothetical protein